MSDKNHKKDETITDNSRDWHPYTVWQKHIKEAEAKSAEQVQNPTGSWRTDTVWQNLIKS